MRRAEEEEGPDAEWLESHAAERRARWEAEGPQRRLAKRQARRAKPLSRRLHDLEVQLVMASTAPAARISGAGGRPDSQAPPAAEVAYGGEHPRELARLTALLERVIERIEALADADPQEPLTGSDIDRSLIEGYEGYSAEDASALEPLFGSPEAVRRARRAAGRSAADGTKRI